jgi:restriction system protein
MYPTLQALKTLGGSARLDEISGRVVEDLGLTEEEQSFRFKPDHHTSLIDYRLSWARNALKTIGAVENSARGVWALTDYGRSVSEEAAVSELRRVRAAKRAAARSITEGAGELGEGIDEGPASDIADADWQAQLIEHLQNMAPDAFERLAQRLLREANFRNVEVLGKSGDGGIDGVGVYRLSLVSFPVFFQCKRYRGSVGPGAVRDFRGAMAGRGEKGLLITTGTFTRDAKAEATREGAPPVELVNGDDLCELLREYGLGVTTKLRTAHEVTVDGGFFAEI